MFCVQAGIYKDSPAGPGGFHFGFSLVEIEPHITSLEPWDVLSAIGEIPQKVAELKAIIQRNYSGLLQAVAIRQAPVLELRKRLADIQGFYLPP